MNDNQEPDATTKTCKHCEHDFTPKRDHQEFCCPAHRAAWHKAHDKVIPGRVCSSAMTADGALVVVVRVPREFQTKFHRLPPRTDISLLEDS